MSRVLRLAPASLLATAQSRIVAAALEAARRGVRVELRCLSTRGDRNLSGRLHGPAT